MKRSKMAAAVIVAAGLGFGAALLIGMGPREPVNVPYVVAGGETSVQGTIFRVWSDGRWEAKHCQKEMFPKGGWDDYVYDWNGWKNFSGK